MAQVETAKRTAATPNPLPEPARRVTVQERPGAPVFDRYVPTKPAKQVVEESGFLQAVHGAERAFAAAGQAARNEVTSAYDSASKWVSNAWTSAKNWVAQELAFVQTFNATEASSKAAEKEKEKKAEAKHEEDLHEDSVHSAAVSAAKAAERIHSTMRSDNHVATAVAAMERQSAAAQMGLEQVVSTPISPAAEKYQILDNATLERARQRRALSQDLAS